MNDSATISITLRCSQSQDRSCPVGLSSAQPNSMAATVPMVKVTNSKNGGRVLSSRIGKNAGWIVARILAKAATKNTTARGAASRAATASKLTDIHKVSATTIVPTKSCAGTNQTSGQAVGRFG